MLKHYINPNITHKWGLKRGAERGTTPLFFSRKKIKFLNHNWSGVISQFLFQFKAIKTRF